MGEYRRGMPKEGRHPNFKGGTSITEHGYIIEFVGKGHHLADCRGYAYQHRLVAEKKLGRPLLRTEYVHHKDENKANNDPENLKVYPTQSHHFMEHRKLDKGRQLPDEENVQILCACGCGNSLWKFDNSKRPRRFIHGHNNSK